MAEGARELREVSFLGALISFMQAPPTRPKHRPEAPFPINSTLGIRFQHMNFEGGDISIHSMAPTTEKSGLAITGFFPTPSSQLEETPWPCTKSMHRTVLPSCFCIFVSNLLLISEGSRFIILSYIYNERLFSDFLVLTFRLWIPPLWIHLKHWIPAIPYALRTQNICSLLSLPQ